MKIKKGDTVVVIAGSDKGKKGKVLQAFPKEQKLLVEGVNVHKKHTRPSMQSAGGIINKELPVHVSNVALSDPKTGEATRVGKKTLADGRKVRFAKKSGETIE